MRLDTRERRWHLKLLAVIIGLGMWIYVVGQEKAEVSLTVPVTLTDIPGEAVVMAQSANQIELTLMGPRSLVRAAAYEGLVKQVELTGKAPGEHVFQVLPEDFKLPPGITVVGISPASILVELATRSTKMLPVNPVINGPPAPGYQVGEVIFKPETVQVSGLKKDLADLDWIWTVPLDVSGLKSTITVKAGLRPPVGKLVRLERNEVQATIVIRPTFKTPAAKPTAGPDGQGSYEVN